MAVTKSSQSIHLSDELAKTHELFFFVSTQMTASSYDDLKPHLPDHRRYLAGLKQEGKVVEAGPFLTADGANTGDGVYVLKADSLQEAQRLAAADPMHKPGLRTFTVRAWAKETH